MQEVDRSRRVSELIHRELSTLIAREVDDQRVKLASITSVTISRDLKHATVYVSSVESTADPAQIEKALNHASKYLRYLLGKKTNLRSTPQLKFQYDHTIRRGMEMSALIDSLNNKHVARA